MRNAGALLISLALVACRSAPVTPTTPSDVPLQFLLTSAASDFQAHGPRPERFRDVRVGHLVSPDGTKSYRICGEFLPAQQTGETQWTAFATVKTGGYEQYIGGQAGAYCQGMTRDGDEDLSAALQERVYPPK